jgi:hypothetical protein
MRIHRLCRPFALVLAVALPLEAGAALGGAASSVEADQAHMNARRQVAAGSAYSVHEITTPAGTVIREFVSSASGQVFAVAWQGPFMPDLKQLLGAHFDTWVASTSNQRHGRGSTTVRKPEVVIHSGGHMRAFSGSAYLPGQLPQGVSIDEIR